LSQGPCATPALPCAGSSGACERESRCAFARASVIRRTKWGSHVRRGRDVSPATGLVALRPLGLRILRCRVAGARGGQCRTLLRVRDASACSSGLRPWAPLPDACVLTPTVWCGFLCSCSFHLCAPRLPAHASRQLQRSGREQAERAVQEVQCMWLHDPWLGPQQWQLAFFQACFFQATVRSTLGLLRLLTSGLLSGLLLYRVARRGMTSLQSTPAVAHATANRTSAAILNIMPCVHS
jgi:hypothetical protein